VITIRQASEDDRTFLLSLADRLADFDRPAWRSADEIVEGDRRALAGELDSPCSDNGLFVALLDGQRAGCLLMWTLEDYFSGERHAHISVIAVTRAAEGQGVGRGLMDYAEQWARARGHTRITLSVFESNKRAQAVYERAGFQVEMRRYAKSLSE
jgi:ribosomal protein S18 acetylase RimI-like enzyme